MRQATFALILASAGVAGATAKDCASLQTQTDLTLCAAKYFEEADARLNETFNRLSAKLGAEERPKLIEAQRAWIKYRDAQCAFETQLTTGGSIHPMEVAQCAAALTKEQTRKLERQINCAGPGSCVGP
jgi:uncharacterized protein YecT (DUF1311 family)